MPVSTASLGGVSTGDWLQACRTAVDGLRDVLREHPTSRERVVETGERGEGGDRTLVIDAAAEDEQWPGAVLDRLPLRRRQGIGRARHGP